jgi:hypothetical protein
MNLNSKVESTSCWDEFFLRLLSLGVALRLSAIFLLAVAAYGADGSVAQTHWVGSWATSQQLIEPANSLAPADIRDATLRQIVHLSLGGKFGSGFPIVLVRRNCT